MSVSHLFFQVEWSCCLARGGFALGLRKEDGTLGAVVVVLPYEKGIPNDLASMGELWRALKPCGMPPRKQLGDAFKGMKARAWAAMDTIEKVKKRWEWDDLKVSKVYMLG